MSEAGPPVPAGSTLARLRAGELAGATRLTLNDGLTEFPREIFDLAESLEVLDLSGNALDDLPADLQRLRRLRVLFCSGNRFTRLPEALGRCPALEMVGFKSNRIAEVPDDSLPVALRWLILSDNAIESLPTSIGRCHRLQKLMLAGNRLRALPAGMSACTRLELLRIAANRFDALPDWLPRLPRLSWLAYAGNPLTGKLPRGDEQAAASPRSIPWHGLALETVLGEGASGVIHRARWTTTGSAVPLLVAVKLFKGAVTSDGWPRDEMAACIAAGPHPNLVPVLGRIAGHPDGSDGLVMELVGPQWRNLAAPPSLATCTRDVYAAQASWAPHVALRIARGVAAAVAQLHRRGILHGDLYAHNLLADHEGQVLLGDFGAASPLPSDDSALSAALKRIEVRAFGCLLEELCARCRPTDGLDSLRPLVARCLQVEAEAEVDTRPDFDEIVAALEAA